MKPNTVSGWFLVGALMVTLADTSSGQWASGWRIYRVDDGLPESAPGSVTANPNGKILVVHPASHAFSELDGYTVTTAPLPPNTGGGERLRASPSGQLWSLGPDGLIEKRDKTWITHSISEIAEAQRRSSQTLQPISFHPVQQDRVLVLLPERLMEFNAQQPAGSRIETVRTAGESGIGAFSGMTVARDGGLWIAGASGVAKAPGPLRNLGPATSWSEYLPPASLGITNLSEPLENSDGGISMVADFSEPGQRAAVHFDGRVWTVFKAGTEPIHHAWRGPDGLMRAASARSLVRWQDGQMLENDEISARRYYDVATDSAGALWLATSSGLFRHAPSLWRIPAELPKVNSFVRCVATDSAGRLWFVSGGKLHSWQTDSHQEFPLPATAVRDSTICSLVPMKDGSLLLGLSEALFQFHPDRGAFNRLLSGDGFNVARLLGTLKDGSACVELSNDAADSRRSLAVYDGKQFQPYPYPLPEPDGDGLLAIFAAQNGDIWISREHGVVCWRNPEWLTFSGTDKTFPEAAQSFIELADGKIWCAAQDKVWQFDGRNWSVARAGFDKINAMLRSRDGSIWIATDNGLHHFSRSAWIENGLEEGLPSASAHGLSETEDGRLCAATARGLSVYHPEADLDPPRTSIRSLAGDDARLLEGGVLNVVFSGLDKWNQTPRDRLLYSYRLDQREWSAFQELNSVSFPDLAAGNHHLQVRAMDRNGNVETTPAPLDFAVALPWFKETRLLVISLAGLAVALFFAGLSFNRHRRLVRSHAEVERKIAERTRELEIANRELLHSQKMTALGTLAAGIAHDFNNILSIIKGSAQIIEDNLENPRKIRTRLDRIKTVVDQGSGIVKAMLGFSRESDGQPEPCDPNEVVQDTVRLLGDRFLREVEVHFEQTADLPKVSASKDFIQQVLLNYIFNAAEAMNGRKQVVLSARHVRQLPPGMVLMPASGADCVVISVRDCGCGIAPENMPRIFEPFFTTKSLSTRRGTGLGLSMVYELAKRMEAGLAVESVPGQGSTFSLVLPVWEGGKR